MAMAAEDVRINLEGLRYERQKLSALVLDPLQEIKDFVARSLRSEEVDRIVECLRHAIRSDTLKTVTDGEALIAVLNLYYGRDNLRVLQRLMKKINCYDLLEILNEWNVTNNPVDTRVLRECGYFPLWIRIKSEFAWFVGNRRLILQAVRGLFRIPEITPGDPDYESFIYMGVSFGQTDLLIYVLAPLCTRNYIRSSLRRNDVCLALEQWRIGGVYFARHSERNGISEDLSATSFTSIDDSVQGDNIILAEDQARSQVSHSDLGVENKGLYSKTPEPSNRYFHSTVDSAQASPQGRGKDLKLVQASIGYVDRQSPVLKVSPQSRPVEPVRVVRPKMIYLDSGRVPSMQKEDSAGKGAEDKNQQIVQENTFIVEQRPQSFGNHILEKAKEDSSGELPRPNQDYFSGDLDENSDFGCMELASGGRSKTGEYRSSDFSEFSEGYTHKDVGKAFQFHSSPKSDGKKVFISTVTLQVNNSKKRENYHGQSVNGKIKKSDKDDRFKASHFPTEPTKNGNSSWYEDDSLEDCYEEMIPEPEPGEVPLQFYQGNEFSHVEMVPEDEVATGKHAKAMNGFGRVSPPQGFHGATPVASTLVKVKTRFVETPFQQPLVLSRNEEDRPDGEWVINERSQEVNRPKGRTEQYFTKTSSVDRSAGYNQSRVQPVFVHRRPFLMKTECKLETEYEDSVFTDTESHGDMALSRFAAGPPSYLPPPDYNGTGNRSAGKLSVDSMSTDTFDRSYKSTLLSAKSVTSICKEKEMFLSREELQMSIRGAEDKEMERQMELCKELMIAAKVGDKQEMERTIDEGVDVDYQNEFGQSALMVASWEGHLGIVETLLNADADPDLQEGFGKSALHEAALGGHHTIVHRLISGGAKINLTDEEQRTPLHYAAMRGKRRIVEVLLLFGANVTLLTKYGESAVELAYSYHHDDIVDLLMSSRDKKIRKEMESQIRRQRLRQLSSTASLPNLSKVSSLKDLSRSRSRPDLRKKKSVCRIQ